MKSTPLSNDRAARFACASTFAGLLLVGAASAEAQEAAAPQAPPDRRVATSPAAALSRGAWNLTLSGFGGYEHSRYEYDTTAIDPEPQDPMYLSSPAGGGTARLSVVKTRQDSTFSFGGGATSVYYRTTGHAWTDVNAYASQATTLGRHTTLSAAETFSYAPYYSIGAFPGLGTFSGTELTTPYTPSSIAATKLSNVYRYGVATNLSHPFTDRTALTASYSLQFFESGQALASFAYQDIGARLSHTVSKSFGVHAGYSYGSALYQDSSVRSGFHSIDVGADLRKALSLSRRTTFSFSTGSAIATHDQGPLPAGASTTEFRLLGSADLSHYIGRTWTARVAYQRDWQLIEGSLTPMFTDAMSAGLSGSAARNVTAGANLSYVIGSFLGSAEGQRDYATTGSGWLQYSVRQSLAIYAQYAFYLHRFEYQSFGGNLPSRFDRNALFGGLTLVLPTGR